MMLPTRPFSVPTGIISGAIEFLLSAVMGLDSMETLRWHLLRSCLVGAAIVVASPWDVAAQDASPTFAKDIAPILQAKCQSCHRPGEMAPMPKMTAFH